MRAERYDKATQWLLPGIMLFLSLVWPIQRVFALQTLELKALERVTEGQVETLKSHGLKSEQIESFRRLVSSASGEVEIAFDRTQKIPRHVSAKILFPSEISHAEEQGYYFFEQFKDLYRMKDPREELKPTRARKGHLENTSIRYQQYYQGVKVLGATIIVNVKSENRLWFVIGKYIPDIDISTEPVVDETTVTETVRSHFVSEKGPDIMFDISTPELGILNPWVFDGFLENKNILIWVVLVKESVTGRKWIYYVGAHDGEVRHVQDSARTIDSKIYDDRGTNPDELWFEDNQQVRQGTPRPETADLNGFVSNYYRYLRNTFGVYSIDSDDEPQGKELIAHAYWPGNANVFCPNACWDCIDDEAAFCQGMVARDIVAHEFTHGLVEHSGDGLRYLNQSGALNESFADVFGEFVDCASGTPNCTWLHDGTRDLRNPLNVGQQPDHIGRTGNAATDHPFYRARCDPNLPPTDPLSCNNTDGGGVHTNNAVPNIVATLLIYGTTSDDPHYNFQIRSFGLTKAQKLYYSTLVDAGLSDTASFEDARNVMYEVCKDFVLNDIFELNDCMQVVNAWASVGVGISHSPTWRYCRDSTIVLSGDLSASTDPHFVACDTTILTSKTMTIDPGTDLYFFPNAKITAEGSLWADGSSETIRLLSSRGSHGIRLDGQLRLRDGGEIKMPVNTYTSTDTRPRAIGTADGQTRSSFIRIDEDFAITDLNVTLNITHPVDPEVTVWLRSPAGTLLRLFGPLGATGRDFIGTVLDDQAARDIGDPNLPNPPQPPYTGSFRPQGCDDAHPNRCLSVFNGENTRGYWWFQVIDAATPGGAVNIGTLDSWLLTFER